MVKKLEVPDHMKSENVNSLKRIRENGYDYNQVEQKLSKATTKMLKKSVKIMKPRVVDVIPNLDYTLILKFTNNETRIFNISTYLQSGIFAELNDLDYFMKVRAVLGSIQWPNGQDLCPDTLYKNSILIQ